jgi:hypothetical protein
MTKSVMITGTIGDIDAKKLPVAMSLARARSRQEH